MAGHRLADTPAAVKGASTDDPSMETGRKPPWRGGLKTVWQIAPAALADDMPGRGDGAPLFDALKNIRRQLERCGGAGVNLWLDGVPADILPAYLPDGQDADLGGYLDRVDRLLRPREFTILLADPHLYSDRLWGAARTLARGVAAEVGLPSGGFDTCAFLGRYSKTPFGIHRGQMSVLTVPILGRKAFWLWPHQYGLDHPEMQDSMDVAPYRGDALYRAADPGELLYWPADFWHIAETDDAPGDPPGPTAAWNIGMWWDNRPRERVLHSLANSFLGFDAVHKGMGVSFAGTQENSAEPPDCFHMATAELAALIDDSLFRDSLRIDWMKFVTADGFRTPPPLLADGTVSEEESGEKNGEGDGTDAAAPLRRSARVLSARLSTGDVCLCANGHAAVFENLSDDLCRGIAAAADGDGVAAGPALPDSVTDFLRAARALRPKPASEAGADRS
ncbi:hypothetical protein [Eilatimonas milleporae]|uniref:JmjC domain-containing protein n=1 Tax=Eilatimonas milleporae TaxID=911205 RepID=A0A3M0CXM5_9PROT|nr:hypothetical protein [Eilatimonas milleporae]RMB12359.1 hypothetical protein BXY39_0855 [Eilatimonas milleporae]